MVVLHVEPAGRLRAIELQGSCGELDVRRNESGVRRPAAVIFDLDGTLADSFDAIWHSLNAALRELGLPPRDLGWVRRHVGRGATELVRDALGGEGSVSVRQALSRLFLEIYERTFCAQTPPFPGARDVLAFVARGTRGRVAVVSNKLERFSRAWLSFWGLDELVAAVVGPDTTGVYKPDPHCVQPVLAAFGVSPEEAIIVGDMEVDAELGKAAGIVVVGVRNETVSPTTMRRAGAAAVLFDLRDLPAWLAGNGHGWDTILLADQGGER